MSVLRDSAYKKYYVNKQKVNMKITFPWYPKQLSPNWTGHHMQKAKYNAMYREICRLQTIDAMIGQKNTQDYNEMHITFVMPDRRWRDTDNCMASFKRGADGMCLALDINDKCFDEIHIYRSSDIGGYINVELK